MTGGRWDDGGEAGMIKGEAGVTKRESGMTGGERSYN